MIIDEINNPYLKYGNYRYQVNQYGDIIDLDNKVKLDLIEKDDGLYVELDWVGGIKLYNAAIVVIVAFRPYIRLPRHFYKDIIPLYFDFNNKNITPNNLTYKLPTEGIVVNGFDEFCYIPEYTNFGISKDGRLLDINKNEIKNITVISDYKPLRASALITKDNGEEKRHPLYRLVAMTYIDHDSDYIKLQVNHINGDHQYNHVSNLEWVTSKENVNHAYDTGLTNNNEMILTKNYITNKIKEYRSIKYACNDLKLDFRYFKDGLEIGFIKIYEDISTWYYIKTKDDEWKNLTEKEVKEISVRRNTEGTDIKALNVFTNNLIIFHSIGKACKELNVDLAGVIYHIKRDSKVPYHGYIFRYLNDNRSLPKFTQEQLYLIKSNIESRQFAKVQQGYFVVNLSTNETKIYTRTIDLSKVLNVYPTTIQRKLKNHGDCHIFNDTYKVTLIKPDGLME